MQRSVKYTEGPLKGQSQLVPTPLPGETVHQDFTVFLSGKAEIHRYEILPEGGSTYLGIVAESPPDL